MGTPLLEAWGSERGMGKGEGVVGKVWGGAADSQRKWLWLSYPRAQPGLPASMRGQWKAEALTRTMATPTSPHRKLTTTLPAKPESPPFLRQAN